MDLRAHPFLRIVLFLIIGIIIFEYSELGLTSVILFALLSMLILSLNFLFKKSLFRQFGIYIGIVCLGWVAAYQGNKNVNTHFGKYEAYLIRINSATELKPKSYKVTAKVLKYKFDSTWHKSDQTVLLYFNKEISEIPVYGDIFLINESPREIEGPKNPFEFNYKKFQNRRGIFLHHFLSLGEFRKIGHSPEYQFLKWAYHLNAMAAQKLKRSITKQSHLAVAEAMLLGTKDEMDNETRDAYATAGAIHILAVSGLHVGILLMMLNLLFGFLSKKSKWLYAILTISCLWAYAIFTGLSPSVSRATLMFSLFQLGSLIQRDKNNINILAGSAFFLLMIKPFWIFEVGFQLSYLAIFGILYLYPYLNEMLQIKSWVLNKLWQITLVSISAQLFTFPLSIYYFHQFPSYFLLSNPIVSLLSMAILFFGLPSLLLSGIPYLSGFLTYLLQISLKTLNYSIFTIAKLPHAKLSGYSITSWEVVLLYLFIFLFILFLIKKDVKYFKASFITFCVIAAINISKDYFQNHQDEITFHFIPRSTGFSRIAAKNVTFYTDSVSARNENLFNYHLKNYYDKKGIKNLNIKTLPIQENLLQFQIGEKKYLWIRERFRGKIMDVFDEIIVSNNAIYNIEKQFKLNPEKILLDDSNTKYRVANLQLQADSLNIELVSLYDSGGIINRIE